MNHLVLLAVLSLGLVGCATSEIVNLTPTQLERNSTGLYPVEAAWNTREQAIRPDSLRPQVLVGHESYPMRRVPVVRDRWETVIPVPADQNVVRYRFKFDYDYNAIPVPRPNSKMSPEYRLEIVDPK